jgi:hypothetical protein
MKSLLVLIARTSGLGGYVVRGFERNRDITPTITRQPTNSAELQPFARLTN